MTNISIQQIIKDVKKGDFYFNCGIPMGYVDGLPIISTKNSKTYLTIPFLRYKVTGEEDKTLIFPIKFAITVSIPDKKIVKFEDFSANSTFRKVDFAKAIGLFRHEAIKKFNRGQYKQKRAELYSMYDKKISSITMGTAYTSEDEKEFKELLNIMIEPSLKPIYKVIDCSFYDRYLG